MKKRITLLIVLMLVFTIALTACGKEKPTEENNTVNLPAVEAGGDIEPVEEPVTNPEPQPTEDIAISYPIEESGTTYFDPSFGYPIDPASPSYDEDMEKYVTELLGEEHTLQFLYDQDLSFDQWVEVLTDENHLHLQLNPGPLQAIIDWLISK